MRAAATYAADLHIANVYATTETLLYCRAESDAVGNSPAAAAPAGGAPSEAAMRVPSFETAQNIVLAMLLSVWFGGTLLL